MSDESAELTRDAELSRARLDLAIDRLESRLTPIGLADEALGLIGRAAGLPIVQAGVQSARRNPLALILIAAGAGLIAWRLMDDVSEHRDGN